MEFINNYINGLKKFDTVLAFTISFFIKFSFKNDVIESLLFSILFVTIFLLFLNLHSILFEK